MTMRAVQEDGASSTNLDEMSANRAQGLLSLDPGRQCFYQRDQKSSTGGKPHRLDGSLTRWARWVLRV